MSLARAQNWTPSSGVKSTNHEANAPPSLRGLGVKPNAKTASRHNT